MCVCVGLCISLVIYLNLFFPPSLIICVFIHQSVCLLLCTLQLHSMTQAVYKNSDTQQRMTHPSNIIQIWFSDQLLCSVWCVSVRVYVCMRGVRR